MQPFKRALGDATSTPTIVGYTHGSFTGFVSTAGTQTPEPAELHVIKHDACQPICGTGHIPMPASVSPLRTLAAGTKSCRGWH
jgi:hypothetical protein